MSWIVDRVAPWRVACSSSSSQVRSSDGSSLATSSQQQQQVSHNERTTNTTRKTTVRTTIRAADGRSWLLAWLLTTSWSGSCGVGTNAAAATTTFTSTTSKTDIRQWQEAATVGWKVNHGGCGSVADGDGEVKRRMENNVKISGLPTLKTMQILVSLSPTTHNDSNCKLKIYLLLLSCQ